MTIGRQPENLLRIDNPAVSGNHAKIYSEGNRYVLEDSESFNGTYVNQQRNHEDRAEGRGQSCNWEAHD